MHRGTRSFAETHRTASLLAGLGAAMMAVFQANGTPAPVALREQLNQAYGPELISVPFSATDRECVAEGATLAGPNGPVAAQLADIEFWPGSGAFVKSARLCFVVDELKPLSTATYTPSAGASRAPAVASDIEVKAGKESVEITTSRVGVRLTLGGETFKEPVAASTAPGPLQSMRLGGDAWAGGSSITGEVKVTRWSARLTDSGPVFARVEAIYDFSPSGRLVMAATVVASDNGVRWEARSGSDIPGAGFVLRLPPVPDVKEAVLPKGYGQWALDRKAAIIPGGAPFGRLAPNTSIANLSPDFPSTIRLSPPGGPELTLASREPGDWVEPTPRTYGGMKFWTLDGIQGMWSGWRRAGLPVSVAADGTILLAGAVAPGHRQWTVSAGPARVGDTLERVKDMVLDWPADPSTPHPRLFVSLSEMKDVWARAAADPELAETLAGEEASRIVPLLMQPAAQRRPADVEQAVKRSRRPTAAQRQAEDVEQAVKGLREWLGRLGNYDVMRRASAVIASYDLLIDSDLVPASDKAIFRAQMAYLGYLMADPKCWSMERGYCSGNPNMSCSYTLSLGVLACALSDHPAARGWAERATQWMDQWLTDEVGPNGEWIPEGSHYSHVTVANLIAYAVAARRAGFHDFSKDARLKKLLLYFAKFNTARDVRRDHLRATGLYGRSVAGERLGDAGVAAAFFKESDPEFSRTMQWMWRENGYPVSMEDHRLGRLDPYYEDRRLPAAAPVWGSELFPELGALLRAGFNTSNESFAIVLSSLQSTRNLDCKTPEVGAIAQWFGRGQPLSALFFHGYEDRHELLRNGVRLARNWGSPEDKKMPYGHYTTTRFGAFAALPSSDYVRSSFENTRTDNRDSFPDSVPAFPKVTPASGTNLVWTRQLLFVKDPDPAGPAWLALRDTTRGGEPTVWQFWTFSEKLGTPEQARVPAAFLADQPGHTNLPARELPLGDRYTALGQFGVDVEYFIASPAKTPRHTLRYGGAWASTRIPDYQDLLHLQLPGDGAYAVAIFPRPREEAPPVFTALADGAVTKVTGAFGTDYAFLSLDSGEAKADGITFRGTAGSVQERPAFTILALPVEGSVAFKNYALAAPMAASLRVDKDSLILDFTADHQGGDVTIEAPGAWKVEKGGAAKMTRNDKGQWLLTVPAGTKSLRLVKTP